MGATLYTVLLLMALFNISVEGHGRLIEPPSRASMFRFGFDNPPDYNDNQGFCGGKQHQIQNGGRCGICGDPWDAQIKEHEVGGKYANGIIVRQYTPGQSIDVQVQLTANHRGYFEFRLCVNNDVKKPATHDCLNQNLLQLSDGSGTKYYVDFNTGIKTVGLNLPAGIVCTQCVLQWKYHVGNSWGTDPDGTSCLGCGQQEEFYACADVSISDHVNQSGITANTPSMRTESPQSSSSTSSTSSTIVKPAPSAPINADTESPESTETSECRAIGLFANIASYHLWCQTNCAQGNCPSGFCSCDAADDNRCRSHGIYKSETMDTWCFTNCEMGYCPPSHCKCDK